MANYLVAAQTLSPRAGSDGIVVTSSRQRFFCAASITTANVIVYTSSDSGVTWSLIENISVANGADYAMYIDTSDNLHLITRDTGVGGLVYRRYDAPGYSLSVTETINVSQDNIYSPLKICVTNSGIVYIFYSFPVGAQNYQVWYARRTGVNTWSINNLFLNALNGNQLSNDVVLGSDGSTIFCSSQGFSILTPSVATTDVRVHTLNGTTITLDVFTLLSGTTSRNHWLQNVNGTIRLYASSLDNIADSANILTRVAADASWTTLFTSGTSTDALRGTSQDSLGVNLFYGEVSGALKRRRHNLDGSLTAEVTEIAAPTDTLYGNRNIGFMNIGYPRKINNFVGGSGIYGQPIGSTRFFSSLSAAAAAAAAVSAEDFLSEWGIQGEEMLFSAYKPYDIEGGEEEESEVGRYIKGR